MDIKEIAEQVSKRIYVEDGLLLSKFISEKFAESLIESYKAELLKEAGEPVAVTNHAQLGYVTDGMHPDIPLAMWAKETSYSGANIALYTSDQLAAAQEENGRLENQVLARDAELWGRTQEILGLKDQLAKAEQLWQVAQGRCDGLEEKLAKAEQRVAEWQPISTAPITCNSLLIRRNGEVCIANWGDYDEVNQPKFTHWMPLPKAPNGASS